MLKNLRHFFKGFTYAFKGIVYNIKTQMNFRFHITAMIWVILLSLFYELSRSEYALLMLAFSSVIVSEAVNTAVEKAVDLTTDKKDRLAAAAKDSAAAAVLIAALFSVAVGIFLFWDTEILAKIGMHFTCNPPALIAAVILAVLSFIFVFKGI
ncbi:MAG: diacylglycerol kinase family protein [Oscillospiraceae bacterium]